MTPTSRPTARPLRLWPGVALVAIMLVVRLVVPVVSPDATEVGVMAGMAGAVAVLFWWVLFSRAPVADRVGAVVVTALALVATRPFLHESVATGMMGLMFFVYALPAAGVLFVVALVATRRASSGVRRVAATLAIVAACAVWTLARTGGITGGARSDFAWRWTPTPEQRLLAMAGETAGEPAARAANTRAATGSAPPAAPAIEWQGFRGAGRDGVIRGVRIETDWTSAPPVELWRRPIGPGWSSFAARGGRLFTQEQRGDDEVVASYDLATGDPLWLHADATRFWESNGGAGPRGTPTLYEGRVYTFGATGILNVLDERDGHLVWSRDAAADAGKDVPYWGFASSPLVHDDAVIVAVAGRLVAYDREAGTPRWMGLDGGGSYSSPHLVTIDGVEQVILMSDAGAVGVAPDEGAVFWAHAWPNTMRVVQPARIDAGDFVISAGESHGTRRIGIVRDTSGWRVEERWTSNRLKPYFNDFVVHEGYAFGFDGRILACMDLEDGSRAWKGGRYGNGQLVLLPDQDLLLVLAEDGELALVSATPDAFTEVARVPVIEGKTWNHPVIVGDVLVVRNGQEMAAFRLAMAGSRARRTPAPASRAGS